MTLDNMAGITKVSYTGGDLFCKSQLITCTRVKECNGVCPFEDALKHADKGMNEQTVIDHDRDWIIGCIEHDGFIHTHRFDKANQIILDVLSADAVHGEWIFNPTDAIDLMFAKPKCSKCGFESSDGGNFCPNCGADMRGEEA